jgi:hypothetical protein
MGGVRCIGRALARMWLGVCGCIGECGGHTLLWFNSKLMSSETHKQPDDGEQQ